MAKPFLCRMAVAQISCNPAYVDELVACVQEPSFPAENEKVGLFTISGLEEVSRLRQIIGEQYIAHLNRKIEAIVRFAAEQTVETEVTELSTKALDPSLFEVPKNFRSVTRNLPWPRPALWARWLAWGRKTISQVPIWFARKERR